MIPIAMGKYLFNINSKDAKSVPNDVALIFTY